MSEPQTAISFKLPVKLRTQIGEVIEKHDTTLTGLVVDYSRRRVQAEKELEKLPRQPGEPAVEVTLLLPAGLHAALQAEASRLRIPVGQYLARLCQAAVRGDRAQVASVFQSA